MVTKKKKEIKLKIYRTHEKYLYGVGLFFLFIGGILVYGIFKEPTTILNLVFRIIGGIFFIGGGIFYLTTPGKEYADVIKCERFEVIE